MKVIKSWLGFGVVENVEPLTHRNRHVRNAKTYHFLAFDFMQEVRLIAPEWVPGFNLVRNGAKLRIEVEERKSNSGRIYRDAVKIEDCGGWLS